ncbi:MAG TPA: aminoglycoside phosphotransferase [Spirochaetes bacterium]|nr:aminoglycoside phosphotransferase [Spirochaetota bacterium]
MAGSCSSIPAFLTGALGSFESVERLPGDASTREYFRVTAEGKTSILCRDDALKQSGADDYPFLIVQRLFKARGIPVPDIYHMAPSDGLLLIQDLGDRMVEHIAGGLPPSECFSLYRSLLDIAVAIQSIPVENGRPPFTLSFDEAKLLWEFHFFLEHCLRGLYGLKNEKLLKELREEFLRVAKLLDRPGLFVLNHRDYHSRNIMWRDGSPFVIDFQDSRMGLPQYDAASLLRDSYVRLDDELFGRLNDYYYGKSFDAGVHRMSPDEYGYYFSLMAFQRNVKALGTFAYQVAVLDRPHYRKYIPATLGYLAAYGEKAPETGRAAALISECMGAGL